MSSGVFETVYMTPIKRTVFLLSRSFTSLFTTTFQTLLTLALAEIIFGYELSPNYGAAILIIGLTVLALYGFAFIYAGFAMLLKESQKVTWILGMLIPLLCGFYYPITILPGWLQTISRLIPITYSADALRMVLIPETAVVSLLPLWMEIALLAGVATFLPFLGYRSYARIERKARIEGTLGRY